MSWSTLILLVIHVFFSACSQPDFAAGSAQAAKDKTKSTQIVPVKATSSILLATDLAEAHYSEGTPGTCNQQILGAGRKLVNENIIPALRKKSVDGVVEMQLGSRSDVLVDMVALSCDKSASKWTFTSNVMVCQRNRSGLGANSLEQGFGTGVVCGEVYPNQTPFAPTDKNIALIAGFDLTKENHLYLVTYKLGASIPSEKFVSLLRKKLGATLKVSVIYPKNPMECVTRGINPSSSDTLWRALPASASGPSNVFGEIASSTGGSTYDLCDPGELEKL